MHEGPICTRGLFARVLLDFAAEHAGFLWQRLPEADFPVQPWPSASSQLTPPAALTLEQDTATALEAAGAASGPAGEAQGVGVRNFGHL